MTRSLRNAFLSGVENVIIMGTDCPGVNDQILATAFEKLHAFDLVTWPCESTLGFTHLRGFQTLNFSLVRLRGLTFGNAKGERLYSREFYSVWL